MDKVDRLDGDLLERVFRDLFEELRVSLEALRGGPFAAAILRGGTVLGKGTNTVLRDTDVSRHAEVNALRDATVSLGMVDLSGASLLTTHFPCLMCFHAARWARISRIYFIFDYDETRELFGFEGDDLMLEDLAIPPERLIGGSIIPAIRVRGAYVEDLYRSRLVELWSEKFRDRLLGYDVKDE
jgi:guanine deaminase